MSLIRIAARIAAVEALKGKTLVGDNVLDSEIGAIDVSADGSARTDEEKAFIAVYTDASESSEAAIRTLAVTGPTEFLFETGITAAMAERDDETGAKVIAGIPATDRTFEFFLDMVTRQIGDALADPGNDWAEVFRRLVPRYLTVKRARTSSDTGGVRMAAQQLKVQAVLTNEPMRGVTLAPEHGLSRFFALAETLHDPAISAQIALMKAQLAGEISDLEIMRARYGRTSGEADAVGLKVVGAPIAEVQIGNSA